MELLLWFGAYRSVKKDKYRYGLSLPADNRFPNHRHDTVPYVSHAHIPDGRTYRSCVHKVDRDR